MNLGETRARRAVPNRAVPKHLRRKGLVNPPRTLSRLNPLKLTTMSMRALSKSTPLWHDSDRAGRWGDCPDDESKMTWPWRERRGVTGTGELYQSLL